MNSRTNPVRSSGATQSISDNNERNAGSQAVSPLVIRNISEKYNIKVYPHCIEFKTAPSNFPSSETGSIKRSTIKDFTKRSRFRLFRTLAKMKEDHTLQPIFVTLTYHHGHEKKHTDSKSQLHHFLVSLRHFDPEVHYIWRFEFQKRGAPHYHLIIFPGNPPFDTDEEKYGFRISNLWHSIADPNSRAHAQYGCKIVFIDSYRKACGYLSKYVAKVDEKYIGEEIGKHWGCSRNMPFDCQYEINHYSGGAKAIIEKLRKWLIEHGKESYSSPEYFNINRDQTVFIDAEDSLILIRGYADEDEHSEQIEKMYDELRCVPSRNLKEEISV